MAEETKNTNETAEEVQETVAAEAVESAEKSENQSADTAVSPVKNTLADIEQSLLDEVSAKWKADDKTWKERFPEFNVGDTVKVFVKIVEGNKERVQPYEGVVIAFKRGGLRTTFMVRRISYEVAIERVFPLYSPFIEKIQVIRKGRVRRAKLYYLRGRFGKAAKIREKVGSKTSNTKSAKAAE